ncbi:MAG: decaprenyl-phosphate phosphoribosyltransferase [Chloroflexi bacterium]|nr:decaprenyl-phosphate phosphoribosyltransferase [Chloroflexota bacterium]
MIVELIKTMRPKQWVKNILLFAALIFDRKLTDLPAFLHILAGFTVFSLFASVVYIINDIVDIEADRQHPTKCNRAIASKKLSIRTAWISVIVLLIIAIPSAFWLSPSFAIISIIYLSLNLAYSQWFKHIVLLDIIILASFYVVRVVAGVALIEIERFSPWLYIVMSFLALFIGAGKRRAEMALSTENINSHRRVLNMYTQHFLDEIITSSASITIITYSLYTFFAPNLPENHIMMLTIPFVVFSIYRYQYLLQVKNIGGAPEDVLLSDTPIQFAVTLYGLAVLIIFYIF